MRARMRAGDVRSKLCNICSGFPYIILGGDLAVVQLIGVPVTFQRTLAITPCWRLPTSLALRSLWNLQPVKSLAER